MPSFPVSSLDPFADDCLVAANPFYATCPAREFAEARNSNTFASCGIKTIRAGSVIDLSSLSLPQFHPFSSLVEG